MIIQIPASCEQPLRVSVFGDTYVGKSRFKKDALAAISPLLEWADANVVNFEGSIPKNRQRSYPNLPFALAATPDITKLLKENKILFVTRANNHSMDYGELGMKDTDKLLLDSGLFWTGSGKNVTDAFMPLFITNSRITLALFSFAAVYPEETWATDTRAGVAYPALSRMRVSIEKATKEYDFVATSFHWGVESSTKLREYQPTMALEAVKAGSSFVFGHHAHMAQGIDYINDQPIHWGIGNFLFSSIGRSEPISIGIHAQFCKDAAGKKTVDFVYSPFETSSKAALQAAVAMTRDKFIKHAHKYVEKKLWSPKLKFFLLEENATKTLEEWLSNLANK